MILLAERLIPGDILLNGHNAGGYPVTVDFPSLVTRRVKSHIFEFITPHGKKDSLNYSLDYVFFEIIRRET